MLSHFSLLLLCSAGLNNEVATFVPARETSILPGNAAKDLSGVSDKTVS
jgi:hypothetical protein